MDEYLAALPDCKMEEGILKRFTENKIYPLSNFLPVPVEEIVYDDGNTRERFFKITAYKRYGEDVLELNPVLVKAANLSSMNWVSEAWGFEANILPPIQAKKDYLRSIICTIGSRWVVRRTVYTHTGWRKIDGAWCFLHKGGAVGGKNVSVELSNKMSAYDMGGCEATKEEKTQAVLNLFKISPKQILYPLIGIAFLSPLNEFLRQSGFEPAFVMYLLGRTQTKKSTIAAIILSFFGRFTASNLPGSFKDTENATEKKCHALKDVLTVIDDFHPVTHYRDRQNMDKLAQALARGFGDRTGKDRMQADTSIRQGYAPRGNAIITGEDFPQIGQSGSARNFIIEINPGDIPASNELDKAQEDAANGLFASFMCGYIEWLLPQAEELQERLKARFLELRAKAIKENISGLGRTGDIVAWLQIGMDFFIDYLVNLKAITATEAKRQKDKAWDVLCGLSKLQLERSEEDKPSYMFVDAIKELLQSGKIYVKHHPEETESELDRRGEMVGYVDKDNYYFLPANTYCAVAQFYSKQNTVFPLTKTLLFKQMESEGIIDGETSGGKKSYAKQKRFGKEKGRYLVIRRELFEED